MIQNFLGKCKDIFVESVNKLKGSDKRIALAQAAKAIGKGGQSIVSAEFGVSRDTIRKGMRGQWGRFFLFCRESLLRMD